MFKKISDYLRVVISEMAKSMVSIKSLTMTLKNMRNDSNDSFDESDWSIIIPMFWKNVIPNKDELNICRENNILLSSEQIQNIKNIRKKRRYSSKV